MKILHVIYDDIGNPWLGGGGATRTLEIYSRMASRGHSVLVLCGHYPGAARRETRSGVRYRRVGLSRSYVLSRLTFMVGAARLIKRGGYDIVIEDVSPFAPVASPLWKPRIAPAVASVQNLSGAHASRKYGLAGWGPRLVERPLLSLFTNFVSVSPGIEVGLRDVAGDAANIRVIPNSVDPLFFQPPGTSRQPRESKPYILMLGRLDIYQKGLDRLLQAFDIVAAEADDVRLVIAGGGATSQERRLRELVTASPNAGQIELPGHVEKEQAASLMKGALMLAMPSRYEAWPLTALEAGAAGVPVVGFDIVGVRDAAPAFPKAHGILVEEGDIAALARAMLTVIHNPELRAQAGAKGREWASGFTWDSLAASQLAFYESLLPGEAV